MYFAESIPDVIRENITKLGTATESVRGYNILLTIIAVFFVLASMLAVYNPSGFDKTLGYGLFITLFLFLIIIFLLKRYISPESGAKTIQYINFAQYIKETVSSMFTVFGKWETIVFGIVILGLFFGLIGSFGLYTNNIPENNGAVIFNYILILIVGSVSYFLFNKASNQDDLSFKTNPTLSNPLSKMVYDDKIKYTLMFILFLLSVIGLYFLNPYGIMSKYGGGVVFFMMFIGMAIFAMIKVNDYFFNNPNKLSEYQNTPGITSFLKVIYIFAALSVSGLLLYGFLAALGVFTNNSGSSQSITHIFVNIVLMMSMLGILYKLINAGGFLERNPYFRLFINTVLYIPCLLVVVTDYLSNIFFGTKIDINGLNVNIPDSFKAVKNDFAFLILSVIACVTYIFVNSMAMPFAKDQYYKVGGETLVTTPIPIGKQTKIASYSTLNGTPNFNYTYAISFWFYIDSFPPSTNSSYSKSVSIMSYGDNLHVKYYSPTNTLYVTVKNDPANMSDANISNVQEQEKSITVADMSNWATIQSSITAKIDKIKGLAIQPELDESNDRIIYKATDVLLQKWNNIVLNYSSGTLDVFYNGELVKSAINVVPNNKGTGANNDMLSVGTANGISGSVSNLTFFKTPIDILTINKLYELFKDKNPPLPSS
jgi:hypothetical protein